MRELPVAELIGGMRAELRNWYAVCPPAWVVHPSRFPPRRGCLDSRVAQLKVRLRLRNGMTLRCRLNEFEGFLSAFVIRDYDSPAIDWASARTIIDVGANVGASVLWFAMHAPQARLIAVEPAPEVFATLDQNVTENGLQGRVTAMQVAIEGEGGTRYMDPHAYSLAARTERVRGAHSAEVEALTLKELLERTGVSRVDVLKLDCEGAEYEIILRAGHDVLSRVGAIVGEFHGGTVHVASDLAGCLADHGFETAFDSGAEQGMFSAWRGQRGLTATRPVTSTRCSSTGTPLVATYSSTARRAPSQYP